MSAGPLRAGLEVVMVTTVFPHPTSTGPAKSRNLLAFTDEGMNERETRKGDVSTGAFDVTGQIVLFQTEEVCQAFPRLKASAQPIPLP